MVAQASENEETIIVADVDLDLLDEAGGKQEVYEISSNEELDLYSIQWKQKKIISTYFANVPPEIFERAANIRLLITDIDGVMTDGGIIYDNDERGV